MFNEKAESLIGKTIKSLEVRDDHHALVFCLEDKEVIFHTHGDCCSHSWIEHFESPSHPETIIKFEEIEIAPYEVSDKSTAFPDDYVDVVAHYFYKLTTDKSTYNIEMRNNSNGYYGGSLE
jgi:hypothetical protein